MFQIFLDQLAVERAGHLPAEPVHCSLWKCPFPFFVCFLGNTVKGPGVSGIHGSSIADPGPNGIRNCWDWIGSLLYE